MHNLSAQIVDLDRSGLEAQNGWIQSPCTFESHFMSSVRCPGSISEKDIPIPTFGLECATLPRAVNFASIWMMVTRTLAPAGKGFMVST